ncbi:MAG TPA: ATP-binding cassette domain-containing protein, partial [Pirellulaceae bacterium]|nr:ATP-binding cassette domain-containing protein [Pirellulaceae bacterium]
DRVRAEGSGGLLGRVLEVETIEQLGLGGGLQSLLSVVSLALAAVVLAAASQWPLALVLVAAVGGAAWQTARHVRRREEWTAARLSLTNELVERMVGHRTTMAQESADRACAEADQALDRYLGPSVALDASTRRLQTLLPHLWLLAGLAWLGPAFVNGSASVTVLAVSLGGLLIGRQGLQRLVDGLDRLVGAWVAWRRLQPFLADPERPEPLGDPDFALCRGDRATAFDDSTATSSATAQRSAAVTGGATSSSEILVEGRELMFCHARRSAPVIQGVEVAIWRGDRVLLEGPSGGGKSTLAALIAGARTQHAGVLLLGGLDRQTLGRAWRRRVVLAPQFNHNHVVMGTFLFNVLLGRDWPPSREEVAEADRVCRGLELGPLLDRMPGGMHQIVGETGWQLSHGERSRLFLARALLQGADMLVLDETFAALDPETLSRTLPRLL